MTSGQGATRAREGIWARFRRSMHTVAREAAAAFARTPLEVLLGASAAVGFSIAMQWRIDDFAPPVLISVGIALPLVYAASALYERGVLRAPLRWGLSAAAVIGAALYGFLLFDQNLEAEGWRAFLLIAASVSALLCVPLVGHRPGRPADAGYRREATHRFAGRLAMRIVIVMAYAGALFLGLALALLAVDNLFELHMGGKPFQHLFSTLFILFPPWAVAAGLPVLVGPIEPFGEEGHKWFRRVGALLVAPLILVYLAIVYAYTVRVLGTGEVPKNLVSPVVLGAGLLIVLATVALEPVHEDEKAGGLALLVRLSSPLLFPLVLFAIWAVNARVDQYGWTEFRYLRLLALVLLGIWGAAAAVQLVRRRRPPLLPLPVGLALVLLLSAIGPWSAMAVARRDQSEGLRTLLAGVGKTGPGSSMAVPSKTFSAIDDKARYLDGHFGWATVQSVAPWAGRRPGGRIWSAQMAPLLGITDNGVGGSRVARATLPDEVGVPGIAGGTLYPFSTSQPTPPQATRARSGPPAPVTPPPSASGTSVRLEPTPGRLLVLAGGDTVVADLASLTRTLMARADSAAATAPTDARLPGKAHKAPDGVIELTLEPSEAVVPLLGRAGGAAGQMVLRTIEVESAPPPAAPAPAKGAPPKTPAPTPATSSPAGAERILRVRSAAGFVILAH